MSGILNLGFSSEVIIHDQQGHELYKKALASREELKNFINTYGESAPYVSIIKSSIIPLRTNNWTDFA